MSEHAIRQEEIREEDDINDISKVNVSMEDQSQMALEIMEDNFLTKEDIVSPGQKANQLLNTVQEVEGVEKSP